MVGGRPFITLIICYLFPTGDNKDSRAASRVRSVLAGIAERLAESPAAINSLLSQVVKNGLDTKLAESQVMPAGACCGSLSDNNKFSFFHGLQTFRESVKTGLRLWKKFETVIGELYGKILKNLIGAARLKPCVFFLKGLHPGLQRCVLGLGRCESLILSLSGSLTVRLSGSAGHSHRGQSELGLTQLPSSALVAGF